MIINKQEVIDFDLSSLYGISKQEDHHLREPAGVSGLKLLAYLGYQAKVVIELGARFGTGALALSHNFHNRTYSYDIKDYSEYWKNLELNRPNLKFYKVDLFQDDTLPITQMADLIYLDIEPHDGSLERKLISYLKETDWTGYLLFDDIHAQWPELKKIWNEIELPKYDLTDIGHKAGSGLVCFNTEVEIC